jgi:hypothetical protein
VAIAGADAAHVLARRAVQSINAGASGASTLEQFAEGLPIVSPIEFEANARPKFVAIDFALLPFVKDVLVASDDGLYAEDDGLSGCGEFLDQSGGELLGCGQRVIISNQNDVASSEPLFEIANFQNSAVSLEGFAVIAKVLASAFRVGGADGAFHLRQRMKLRSATTKPK